MPCNSIVLFLLSLALNQIFANKSEPIWLPVSLPKFMNNLNLLSELERKKSFECYFVKVLCLAVLCPCLYYEIDFQSLDSICSVSVNVIGKVNITIKYSWGF